MDEQTKRKAIKQINTVRALTGKLDIPFKGGRPIRPYGIEGRIKKDDILNLTILLNTSKTFDEFIFKC